MNFLLVCVCVCVCVWGGGGGGPGNHNYLMSPNSEVCFSAIIESATIPPLNVCFFSVRLGFTL